MSFHVRSGPWTSSQIEAWLIETVVPLRLASAGKRGPLVDEIDQSTVVLQRLVARYGQSGTQLADWLLGRIETEVAVRIDDLRITSWDYAPRM